MRVRFFGKKGCAQCQSAMTKLHAARIPFMYIDAEAPVTQLLCDSNGVDELPHIQFIDESNKVVSELIGYLTDQQVKLAFSSSARKNA